MKTIRPRRRYRPRPRIWNFIEDEQEDEHDSKL
jgi:hypothetical protein